MIKEAKYYCKRDRFAKITKDKRTEKTRTNVVEKITMRFINEFPKLKNQENF